MSEKALQMALIEYCDRISASVPDVEFLFHTPNGGQRHVRVAADFKRMGVRRGVPDLMLPLPDHSGQYIGLAIELKIKRGRATDQQLVWMQRLSEAGWATAILYDWTDAARMILKHLGKDPRKFGL